MNMRKTLFIVVATLALVTVGLPEASPAFASLSPVGSAQASCVIGSDGSCLVPLVCVTDPCPHFP